MIPSNMPVINDLTVSTHVTEVYSTSSDLLYTNVTYTYNPFPAFFVILFITHWIVSTLIKELLIKYRS